MEISIIDEKLQSTPMFFFISPIISLFPQVTLADPPFSTEKSYMLLRHACPIHPFFSFPMLLLNKGVSDLMKIQIWFHNLRILCTMCPDSFSATNHNLKGLLGINHLIETMHLLTIRIMCLSLFDNTRSD
mgnify:CR=1 FL=1